MHRALVRLLPRLQSAGAVAQPDLHGFSSVLGRSVGAAAGRTFASDADLLKTPLYDLHVEHSGGCLRPGIGSNSCLVDKPFGVQVADLPHLRRKLAHTARLSSLRSSLCVV